MELEGSPEEFEADVNNDNCVGASQGDKRQSYPKTYARHLPRFSGVCSFGLRNRPDPILLAFHPQRPCFRYVHQHYH